MISVSAVRGYMTPERAAVSALFFTNGYIVGNWAPKIPGFKAALGIDEAVLGLLILAFGLGSLAVMPLVGAVITREGSRRICRLTALALTPSCCSSHSFRTSGPRRSCSRCSGAWSAAWMLR